MQKYYRTLVCMFSKVICKDLLLQGMLMVDAGEEALFVNSSSWNTTVAKRYPLIYR